MLVRKSKIVWDQLEIHIRCFFLSGVNSRIKKVNLKFEMITSSHSMPSLLMAA